MDAGLQLVLGLALLAFAVWYIYRTVLILVSHRENQERMILLLESIRYGLRSMDGRTQSLSDAECIYCPQCECPSDKEAAVCGRCGHKLAAK